MLKIFESWCKRAEFSTYWDSDPIEYIPLISFSIHGIIHTVKPMVYFDTYDKDRWVMANIIINISKYQIYMMIPFKKLPDAVVIRDGSGRIARRSLRRYKDETK